MKYGRQGVSLFPLCFESEMPPSMQTLRMHDPMRSEVLAQASCRQHLVIFCSNLGRLLRVLPNALGLFPTYESRRQLVVCRFTPQLLRVSPNLLNLSIYDTTHACLFPCVSCGPRVKGSVHSHASRGVDTVPGR